MAERRQSYVQQTFDALREQQVHPGHRITLSDVLKRVPWAAQFSEERNRFTGALAALVGHGLIERTNERSERGMRVYRVLEEFTDRRRPTKGARPLGLKYAARSSSGTRDRPIPDNSARITPTPSSDVTATRGGDTDTEAFRRRLESLERTLSVLTSGVKLLREEFDKNSLEAVCKTNRGA